MKPNLRRDQDKDQPSQDTRHFQYASNGSSQKKVLTLTESSRKVLTRPNLHQNNGPSKDNGTIVEDDVDYDVDYEDEFIPDNDDAKDEDYIDQDEDDEDDEDDEFSLENDQDDAEIFRLGYLQQRYSLRKFGA